MFETLINGQANEKEDLVYNTYKDAIFSEHRFGVLFNPDSSCYDIEKVVYRKELRPLLFILQHEQQKTYLRMRHVAVNISENMTEGIYNYNDFIGTFALRRTATQNADMEQKLLINILEVKRGKTFIPRIVDEIIAEEVDRVTALEVLLTMATNTVVRVFYKKDEHDKLTVISTDNTSTTIRRVMATIPIVFRDFVTLSTEAKEVFRLFGGEDYDKYAQAFDNYMNAKNVLKNLKRDACKEAVKRLIKNNTREMEADIQNTKNSIRNYENELIKLYNRLEEEQTRLLAALIGAEDKEEQIDELTDYLIGNKKILKIVLKTNETVAVTIMTDLLYYDKELIERLIERRAFYDCHEDTYKVLKEVFVTQRFTLELKHYVEWSISDSRLFGDQGQDGTYAYNPHLQHYNCWGNNKLEFIKCCKNKQIITAMELMVASVASMNFNDSTVRDTLISLLTGRWKDIMCLRENSTGEKYSPRQVRALLKDEEVRREQEEMEKAAEERRQAMERIQREQEEKES